MSLMKDNISEEEVRKFNKLAQEWWNPDGSFAALHTLNPLRFNYIKNWTELDNKKCLDIGCGGGILTESLSKYADHVDGLDMADKAILVAEDHQELMGIKNITYHKSNLENFVEVNHQQYDVLTCMEMLEHVPSPEQIIESCSKAVKNGGHLFLSTINRNIKSYLMAIVGAEYILKLLPQGTHEFDSFIKPSEIEKWSRNSGLNLIDLTGVMYNPITKNFKLTDDVSVNYMMYFRKD